MSGKKQKLLRKQFDEGVQIPGAHKSLRPAFKKFKKDKLGTLQT